MATQGTGGEFPKDDDPIPTTTSAMDYPTIYVDGVWFATNLGNVVRLQFLENVLEPGNSANPGLRARHVVTLAMPRIGFKHMLTYLNNMDKFFDDLDAENASS